MDEKRTTFDVLKASVIGDDLRVVGWAYKTHNADGTLVRDNGGITTKNGVVIDATDQDVIDNEESEKALEDSLYEFVGSGKGSADDMHDEFGIGRVVGGLYINDAVAEVFAAEFGVEKIQTRGALIVVDIPRTHALAKSILSGKRTQMSIVGAVEREEIADAA